MTENLRDGLELRSCISADGMLEIELVDVPVPVPATDEILIRMEAAPINPSDQALLLGPVDPGGLASYGTKDRPVLRAALSTDALNGVRNRAGQSLAVGTEGAGTVVRAGDAVADLVGRKVAVLGGGMYTRYRLVKAEAALVLPDGINVSDGASAFVNPLTALAMVELMREGGHEAIAHTAGASNLGQMLVRLCRAENIPLVSIVRSAHQAARLSGQGARHVVDSSAAGFVDGLTKALAETGATIAFDAIGGGAMANHILSAMEAVGLRNGATYNRYGSGVFKQIYIYGSLDTGPTLLDRRYGFDWAVSGFLVTPFLQRIGPERFNGLKERIQREVQTVFANDYSHVVSMTEMLNPDIVRAYTRKATGEKYIVDPSR
jgi:NADPH:quinone reductase-like Zn-dependent oxidoreductase